MIGDKPKTPLHKALYMTLMEVKHKADCEQPLATINVMNRIAQLFGYGLLHSTTEVLGHSNLLPREVECARLTTSLSRKGRKEEAVRMARAGCVYSAKELSNYEEIKIGIFMENTTELCHPLYILADVEFSTTTTAPVPTWTSAPTRTTIRNGK